jgi:transcriptional regulator with XRE-family HTH domain
MPKSSTAASAVRLLQVAMEARGMSQLALAKLSGIPQATLRRLMRQAVTPTADMLERLAEALGIPASDILHAASSATGLVVSAASPRQAKRVARLNLAYAQCDDACQRLLLELAERLAASRPKRGAARR